MINFWQKVDRAPTKLSCVVFRWLKYRKEATQGYIGNKLFLKICGIPLAEEYVALVFDYEFNMFIKTKCHTGLTSTVYSDTSRPEARSCLPTNSE